MRYILDDHGHICIRHVFKEVHPRQMLRTPSRLSPRSPSPAVIAKLPENTTFLRHLAPSTVSDTTMDP